MSNFPAIAAFTKFCQDQELITDDILRDLVDDPYNFFMENDMIKFRNKLYTMPNACAEMPELNTLFDAAQDEFVDAMQAGDEIQKEDTNHRTDESTIAVNAVEKLIKKVDDLLEEATQALKPEEVVPVEKLRTARRLLTTASNAVAETRDLLGRLEAGFTDEMSEVLVSLERRIDTMSDDIDKLQDMQNNRETKERTTRILKVAFVSPFLASIYQRFVS